MPAKYLLVIAIVPLLVFSAYAQRALRLQGEYGLTHTFYYFSSTASRTDAQRQFSVGWLGFNAGVAYDIHPTWTIQTKVGLFELAPPYKTYRGNDNGNEAIGEVCLGLRKRFILASGLKNMKFFCRA